MTECCEVEKNEAYELGKMSSLAQLALDLRQESGEAFADGKDDRARWLRSLADKLHNTVLLQREAHDKKYGS